MSLHWSPWPVPALGVFLAMVALAVAVFRAGLGRLRNRLLAAMLALDGGTGLLFALVPLQRFAERVSGKAMAGVKPVGEISGAERATTHRELSRAVWVDGSLSSGERSLLGVARERLGVSREEAESLEEEVIPA